MLRSLVGSEMCIRDRFSFLHLNDNAVYVNKGQEGYDPCKKLGYFHEYVTSRFSEVWLPNQNLSIDEGCIPFKGRIHFRCYNPKKIDKGNIYRSWEPTGWAKKLWSDKKFDTCIAISVIEIL